MGCRHLDEGSRADDGSRAERLGRGARLFWHWLLHNRLAIVMASLVWLIWRSGTQPRRLSYPCQRAAALNVSVVVAGLVPSLFLARKPECPHAVARAAAIRRQVLVAFVLLLTGFFAVETYQFAETLVPPSLPDVGPNLANPMPTMVGIYRQAPAGGSYTTAEIETMVRNAVALAGGLDSLMVDRNNDGAIHVVIKPNLVQLKWAGNVGVVTDPRTCAAVVKIAKEAGAQTVTIAEGTADDDANGNSTWLAFQNAGYDGNGDGWFDYDTSVQLYDLNDAGGTDKHDPARVTLVTIPSGAQIRTAYYVPNILLNADVMISVPTFKNHGQGTVTLSLKNHVGCAPNDIYHHPSYPFMKWSLLHSITNGFPCGVTPCPSSSDENQIVQRTVVDLNLVRPHDFAVVDALFGMTNGPNASPPTYANPKMQMMIAGRDGVAVDAIGTLCMKYNPDYVPQIARADATGLLGTKDRRYITVLGNHVATVRSSSFPANYAGSVIVETTPPAIGDISVAASQEVRGLLPITVSGESDNMGVIKAELTVDGQYVATDRTAPYAFEWDSDIVPPGTHSLTVTVYDAAMNEASITRSITVLPHPADLNADRSINQADIDLLWTCSSGPGVIYPPLPSGCPLPLDAESRIAADFDRDGDVDQADFGTLQRCLGNAEFPPAGNCAE